ncbi:SRPBCC family protein [Nocardioides rotundus]|uniref:SRPBCC family protein n=1 Tax=Nocardioides rotundus TaxID=1774216 RepID=UPI001CBB02BD|nr:SRPBCC family protein [Nocardioides rotundus]UAL31417.1 SRPBCC family protein [Nocardioides rotundus]
MDIQDERIEVERFIAAEPERIFAVLTDPRGHVAIDSSGMLMSATGDVVRGVGDRFEVHMDREALGDVDLGEYDVTVVIETLEPDREISWSIEGVIKPPIGHVYGYRLVPHEGGTLVTSFYDWSRISDEWRDAGTFPVVRPESLKATLGILARTVTHPRPATSS